MIINKYTVNVRDLISYINPFNIIECMNNEYYEKYIVYVCVCIYMHTHKYMREKYVQKRF